MASITHYFLKAASLKWLLAWKWWAEYTLQGQRMRLGGSNCLYPARGSTSTHILLMTSPNDYDTRFCSAYKEPYIYYAFFHGPSHPTTLKHRNSILRRHSVKHKAPSTHTWLEGWERAETLPHPRPGQGETAPRHAVIWIWTPPRVDTYHSWRSTTLLCFM